MTDHEYELFLAERRKGIGSSDIGAIFRCNEFGYGPIDVALEKMGVGRSHGTRSTRMGNKLEPIIAELFTEETGIRVVKAPTAVHQEHSWMRANADFLAVDEFLVVETKARGDRRGWGDAWTDRVPQDILLQCQWQMACYGIHEARVVVLFRLSDLEQFVIPYSEELVALLIESCWEFWEKIQRGEMPATDWSDPRTPELIPLMYKPDPKVTVQLGNDALAMVEEIQLTAQARRQHERREKELKARLIEMMGTAGVAQFPNGILEARRVTISKGAYEVKAHDESRLSFHKRKPTN